MINKFKLGFVIFLICSGSLFSQRFEFAFNVEGGLSQIEGDQLFGFNNFSYSYNIQGFYKLNETKRIVVNLGYGAIGSERNKEKTTNMSNDYLLEMSIKQTHISFLYANDVGENWEGKSKFRLYVGVRLNAIIEIENNLISNVIINNNDSIDLDIENSWYPSLGFGVGFIGSKNISVQLMYYHGLTNLLHTQKLNFSKLVPFGVYFGVSYNI